MDFDRRAGREGYVQLRRLQVLRVSVSFLLFYLEQQDLGNRSRNRLGWMTQMLPSAITSSGILEGLSKTGGIFAAATERVSECLKLERRPAEADAFGP